MLSIISIGIQNYPNSSMLNSIPCASVDCKNIYDAFKNIMDNDFAEHTSACLTDLSAIEYVNLLNALEFSNMGIEDTLILYFSGHAKSIVHNVGTINDLTLRFSDYNETTARGDLSLSHQIVPILNRYKCEIVLILDCCYSGTSLALASQSNLGQRISVLTSNSEYGLAKYDNDGSEFSKSICESIYEIQSENLEFTLNTLQSRINKRNPYSCINMGASNTGNIVLKPKQIYDQVYFDFDKRFIKQISRNDRFFREAIWYSLSDLPFQITEKIYNTIFHCINLESRYPLEASWLVRRAIGSSISCIESKKSRIDLAKKLINSPYWQEQCIGIIGARYDIAHDTTVFNLLIDKVSSRAINKIDVLWLANLYAADNENYNFNVFIKTNLMNQPWGIQEIYTTAVQHGTTDLEFIDLLNKNTIVEDWIKTYSSVQEVDSELYRILSCQKPRGRLPVNSKAKFILSVLYGNWRGDKLLNLRDYFYGQRESIIRQELLEAANYLETEYRMAIFEYLSGETNLLQKYSDVLQWGLQDTHPWVRRTAIQSFKAANICIDDCNRSITEYLSNNTDAEHIGELDLLLEYSYSSESQKSFIVNYINQCGKFSESEIESVIFGLDSY